MAILPRMPNEPGRRPPIRVALANDYEVVVLGLAQMLAPYPDRIEIVEMVAGEPVTEPVDITLYDSFAQPQVDADDIEQLVGRTGIGRVVVFTWNVQPALVDIARRKGVSGYLPKSMTAEELVDALERVHAGEVVMPIQLNRPDDVAEQGGAAGRWPGQAEGLTVRESEVVALITMGLSNKEIASRAYLSINSVKSYIRAAYRKMGVTTRSQAVLWAVQHGFLPGHLHLKPAAEPEPTA